MLVECKSFAPDLPPTEPGVLTDCVAKIPTLKGMKAAPSRISLGLPALAAACKGSKTLEKLDGTQRLFAGTTTKLYEANGITSWTDVTRASGNYNLTTDIRWRYTQYGDVSLAINKQDKLQFIDSGAKFADVSTTVPQASIVETVNDFVFLFDCKDQGLLGPFGDQTDRWWCSAIGDYTDWTPAIATQCVTGRLKSSPGGIRAGRRLGSGIVAYKEKSMFLGQYVGAPLVWDFQEVSNVAGAQSQEVVVPIVTGQGGSAHIFMGPDNFYYYDGSRPVPIGTPVKDWFFGRLNQDFAYLSEALNDAVNSLIYFFYPSVNSASGALDSCVVYNYRADKWGVYDQDIEAAVQVTSGGLTYAGLESTYATYSAIPDVSYGSPFWFAGSKTPAVFDTSHVIKSLTGAAGVSSMTTGDLGDDSMNLLLSRVRPRYFTAPTSAMLTNYSRQNLGDTLTVGMTTSLADGKFDVLQSAKWHRVKVEDTGDSVVPALVVDLTEDGDEQA